MTRRADQIIKNADPAATVVCPSMGRLGTPQGLATLRQFAALGGYRYCDVAGVKLYPRSPPDPPETMLSLAATIEATLHRAGVRPPLWNTGTTYDVAVQPKLDQATAVDYAVRFYLIGLYTRFDRMYVYDWGGTKIPIVLQVEGGVPTEAARAVARLQLWLAGTAIYSCGHGAADGLPDHAWQCRFVEQGNGSLHLAVQWTDPGPATVVAQADSSVENLDGSGYQVRIGEPISIGPSPVLVVGHG